jgi:hypothetical protein
MVAAWKRHGTCELALRDGGVFEQLFGGWTDARRHQFLTLFKENSLSTGPFPIGNIRHILLSTGTRAETNFPVGNVCILYILYIPLCVTGLSVCI